MKKSLRFARDKLLELNQVALLMLAIALIFIPATHIEAFRILFKATLMVECLAVVSRALRLGYGRKSPEELGEQFERGATRVTKTTLERLSIFSAIAATIVLAFS